jgi:hypothetical protein
MLAFSVASIALGLFGLAWLMPFIAVADLMRAHRGAHRAD